MQKPKSGSRHLYAGYRLGSMQVSPRLLPGMGFRPGFDIAYLGFDASTVVRLSLAFLTLT